jgi:hypothetical protein
MPCDTTSKSFRKAQRERAAQSEKDEKLRNEHPEWAETRKANAIFADADRVYEEPKWEDDPDNIALSKKDAEKAKLRRFKEEDLKDWPWEGRPNKLVTVVCYPPSTWLHFRLTRNRHLTLGIRSTSGAQNQRTHADWCNSWNMKLILPALL